MAFVRVLIQLVLFAVIIAAGFKGFQLLKGDVDKPATREAAQSRAKASSGTAATDTASQTPDTAQTTAGSAAAPAAGDTAQSAPTATEDDDESDAWPVAVITVDKARRSPSLGIYGEVETPRETTLSAAVSADVLTVSVLEGQEVERGALLVELDATDLKLVIEQRIAELQEIDANTAAERRRHRANLDSLESEREMLALSKRQLERVRTLASRQIGTQVAVDDAERSVRQHELTITNRQNAVDDHSTTMATLAARKERIEAQLRQARRDLERTRINAPFSGRITAVNTSPGNRVRPGESLLSLYDTAFVEVRAQIPNRLVPVIRSAIADGTALRGIGRIESQRVDLVVDRLAARTRAGSGSVDALLRVTGKPAPQLGRTLDVTLEMPAVDASFAVPSSAITEGGRVYTVNNGQLESAAIVIVGQLRNDDNDASMLVTADDIDDGDLIVVSQVPAAHDGLPVRIIDK